MGALHEGHLSLVEQARKDNDYVISSVFVNPAQFGPNEDLDKYPRQLETDAALLESLGVDLIFAPNSDEMYGPYHSTYVDPEAFNSSREGQSRPGFFKGVATIVTKLFNIVQPTHSYFGQKDAVQGCVIKRMVDDLNIPVEVVRRAGRRGWSVATTLYCIVLYLTPLPALASLLPPPPSTRLSCLLSGSQVRLNDQQSDEFTTQFLVPLTC